MKLGIISAILAVAASHGIAVNHEPKSHRPPVRRQSKSEANDALRLAQEKRDRKAARNLRNQS